MSGQLVDWGAPAPVRDISLGGFALDTSIPLDPGVEHRVRFLARDNWSITLAARVVNCQSVAPDGCAPQFVAGFAFADNVAAQTSASAPRVNQLLSSLRHMPRLLLRPWDAPWVETTISHEIAAQGQSPARALIDRLSTP